MPQGNPFQDWGGQSQVQGGTDDPFGQFPFQAPKPQQQQQQQQQMMPSAQFEQPHAPRSHSNPQQTPYTNNSGNSAAAAPRLAPASQQPSASAGGASGDALVQFHPHAGGVGGGGVAGDAPSSSSGVPPLTSVDNPFESLFGDTTASRTGASNAQGGADASSAPAATAAAASSGSLSNAGGFIPASGPGYGAAPPSGNVATAASSTAPAAQFNTIGTGHQQHQQHHGGGGSTFPPSSGYPQQRQQGGQAATEGALVPYQQGGGVGQGEGGVNPSAGSAAGGGGVGPGSSALVPFGHPFEQQQQQQQQQHHHQGQQLQGGGGSSSSGVGAGGLRQQQQQQGWGQQAGGGGGGGSVVVGGQAPNPFDDLFAPSVRGSSGFGAGVGGASGGDPRKPQQQQQRQQQQQPWGVHPGQQQQQQQQQRQQWHGIGGGGGGAGPEQNKAMGMRPHQQYQPQQQQQQQQQQGAFPGNLAAQQIPRVLSAGNPFVPASGDVRQQQQPRYQQGQQQQANAGGAAAAGTGYGVFGDDPFGGNTSSALTTTGDGFIAVTGGGRPASSNLSGGAAFRNGNTGAGSPRTFVPGGAVSSTDPFDPFDLEHTTPTGYDRRRSSGEGSDARAGSGSGSGGGRELRRPRSSSVPRRSPPPSASADRWEAPVPSAGGPRSRSSSVPRGTSTSRARSPDGDPFGSNSARHGPQRGAGDSDRSSGGGASPTSRRSTLGRSKTLAEMLPRGRGKTRALPGDTRRGGPGAGAAAPGTDSAAASGGGGGWGPGGRDDHDDDENDDDDGGSDSDNDDALSTMDVDAMREAMGGASRRRSRETGGIGSGPSGRGRRGSEEYVVEFERERKLGMLLERHDEWPDGRAQRSERAIVKMVVDSGPAQIRGVTVGSKVKKVNAEAVEGLTYQQTLERIKNATRPLRVLFERGQLESEDNVGQIMFKKTVGVPRSFSAWQRRYFVLGGAVAKAHVLQVYVSKQSYDRMVLAVFGRQRINERVKAYKLNNLFKCGPIRVKRYKGQSNPLNFFTVRLPTTRLKQLNFASHSLADLQHLRTAMARFTSKS